MKNGGFLVKLQQDLKVINSKIKSLNDAQNKLNQIILELRKENPNCDTVLDALTKLKDDDIGELKSQIEKLKSLQSRQPASSQQITNQKDKCKDVCTTILKNINGRLTAVVASFNEYQTTINALLDDINKTLTPESNQAPISAQGLGSDNNDVKEHSTSSSSNVGKRPPELTSPHAAELQNLGLVKSTTGGYYYPTSSSGSKRNKKSTRNRKKNKKNKKTRR